MLTDIQYKEPVPIGNKVNLHIIQTDKFKTAVSLLLIRRPLSRGESTKNAVLKDILRQGSRRYPSMQTINKRMEELFGSTFDVQIVKKGEEQILQFYFEGIPNDGNVYKGIEFLSEVALNPLTGAEGFNREALKNAGNNVKNIIDGRINNKAEYARVNCLAHMCGDEPFAVYTDGYAEDLADLTENSLYRHYQDILTASPVELICAGDLDEAELATAASGFNIPDRRPESIPFARCFSARPGVRTITETFNSAQGKICMGLRSDISPVSRHFYALLVMNEILGGGPNSKLFTKIREREGMCYYINSTLYRFKSIILIQSGVDAGHFEHIVKLASREIDEICLGRINHEEWEAARQSIISKFRIGLDHYPSILDFYTARYLLGDKKNVNEAIQAIESVTMDEAAEAARRVKLDTVFELT